MLDYPNFKGLNAWILFLVSPTQDAEHWRQENTEENLPAQWFFYPGWHTAMGFKNTQTNEKHQWKFIKKYECKNVL